MNVCGEIDSRELLNIFEYAHRKYNVDQFFIDSLMRVGFPGQRELYEHKQFCSDLVSFAKQYHSHVHLVAHPRKVAKDQDRPGKVDISGTFNISNLAHNVLVLWRPNDDAREIFKKKGKKLNDCYLHVKKNREWGDEGRIAFDFDSETKIFTEID